MKHGKLVAGAAGMAVAVAVGGAVVADGASSAPENPVVKQSTSIKMKPNRYIQDGLRFKKDNYSVKSGGTVTLRNTVADEGPHSLSVVKKKDLPSNGEEVFNCKVCNKLGQAHGADPNGEGPPEFQYLEDGEGQNDPPNLDKPGDSGVTGPEKGDEATFHVTAKPGTTLRFLCIIHPWMQAKLHVK